MQTIKLLEKKLDELDLPNSRLEDTSTLERRRSLWRQIEALQPPEYILLLKECAMSPNSDPEAHGPTVTALNGIMEALADANSNMIGVCRSHRDLSIQKLLETLNRRIRRDNLFDVVVKAAVTKEPVLEIIQEEIGSKLDLKFDRENVAERANLLWDRIKQKEKILIILCDVCKGMDLGQVGIPFGVHHPGCKILLTSQSEEILFKEMKGHGKLFFMPSMKTENLVPSPPPVRKRKMFQKLRCCWA